MYSDFIGISAYIEEALSWLGTDLNEEGITWEEALAEARSFLQRAVDAVEDAAYDQVEVGEEQFKDDEGYTHIVPVVKTVEVWPDMVALLNRMMPLLDMGDEALALVIEKFKTSPEYAKMLQFEKDIRASNDYYDRE
ncbi:hypothetical protein [Pseudodesulfovibrio pelocollis]|uniref:hypothetical protein n=1 Tax=Pseudodesulfovibrio pelocollis TaxID=3051432 RepID=UPI00255AAD18|nr:hypothetical protein [Pseudodesulfovibrio sp. SB368]